MQKWFPAADVFVCPSPCHELLTGAHYEAMASGLPIITTNESGCSEVIQANKAGIIVMQPQLSSDFVEHLLTLFHNDDFCAKLGENGRKLAEKQFSWDRVAREILDTWRILYKETQSMQNDLKTVKLFSLK
ncbi:glycosyltransferase [Bacillus sp. JCM 19034]|uniref:glycosyltransferase n=1 Tax=Bacillus sp. JCM 19034 TaxID=1481928 RepID=UPI0007830041|nr:glycosyltransferase family 4 protein [Bacillus sp. JCM 19034]